MTMDIDFYPSQMPITKEMWRVDKGRGYHDG